MTLQSKRELIQAISVRPPASLLLRNELVPVFSHIVLLGESLLAGGWTL